MRSKHYTHAASMVRAILAGKWTHEAPDWADYTLYYTMHDNVPHYDYLRAVATAESFIMLFKQFSAKFDERLFLRQCGLLDSDARRI